MIPFRTKCDEKTYHSPHRVRYKRRQNMRASRVAIVGVGFTPFRSISPDVSFREMMFEAATRAYQDAGVHPQDDIDSFVTCQDDFEHGRSIWNMQTPDNLGAVLKPIHIVTNNQISYR